MSGMVIKGISSVSEEDLEQINRYTRRRMEAGEVYTFSVALCDNEVDRDLERFSIPALEKLKELFLGKTGIFDHAPKSENQAARIFATSLEIDTERKTMAGEPYTRLVAKAYLPRSEKQEPLILEIDSGIKKEVSIGCSVSRRGNVPFAGHSGGGSPASIRRDRPIRCMEKSRFATMYSASRRTLMNGPLWRCLPREKPA